MEHKEFYDDPAGYVLTLNYSDYKSNCDFFEWCFLHHSNLKTKENIFLDICAGPAFHALEFSRRNWKAYALDLSESMRDFAVSTAQKEAILLNYYIGDMKQFVLPEKVSLSVTFDNSISHILTNEDFIMHLNSVRENTVPGGIYIIDFAHPRLFFPLSNPGVWKAHDNDTEIEMIVSMPDDHYDTVTQIWDMTFKTITQKNGNIIRTAESIMKQRYYLTQELKALFMLSGIVEQFTFYGSHYLPPIPLTHGDESISMTVVLKFKE
ncbi:MAG: class I SAM-dependent methyltransferase [Desulfobacterales bacterium]|nr:class I SAM-dependent methyltransferase [Desulfobacterales bacterium]